MKLRSSLALAGSLIIATGFLAGCGDTTTMPAMPDQAALPDVSAPAFSAAGVEMRGLARFEASRSTSDTWAVKWIGPDGGRIEFRGFAIDVPAGAVESWTAFSIRLPDTSSDAENVVAKFGPSRTFSVPVRIELPYDGTTVDGESAIVIWWDESRSAWINYGGVTNGETIHTTTDHFSTYGTTEDDGETNRGDTVILSGG